jgi:hypothetical protein
MVPLKAEQGTPEINEASSEDVIALAANGGSEIEATLAGDDTCGLSVSRIRACSVVSEDADAVGEAGLSDDGSAVLTS